MDRPETVDVANTEIEVLAATLKMAMLKHAIKGNWADFATIATMVAELTQDALRSLE